jgi:hypothetical protein
MAKKQKFVAAGFSLSKIKAITLITIDLIRPIR